MRPNQHIFFDFHHMEAQAGPVWEKNYFKNKSVQKDDPLRVLIVSYVWMDYVATELTVPFGWQSPVDVKTERERERERESEGQREKVSC